MEMNDIEQSLGSRQSRRGSSEGYCGFWRKSMLWDYAMIALVFLFVGLISLNVLFQGPVRYLPHVTHNPAVKAAAGNQTTLDAILAEARAFNTNIAMPYYSDTVPYWVVLLLIAIPIPLLSGLISWHKQSLFEFHSALMALLQGCSLQLLFVEAGKILASRFRPDFLSRCDHLNSDGRCTSENASRLSDGSKSFPSGHSSSSFFAMLLLSLYIAGKLRIMHGRRAFWKLFVCSVPPFISFWIAISRTVDYHHNFSDIVAGSVIGSAFAVIAYYLHYPALSSPKCAEPLPYLDDDHVDEKGGAAR